MTECASLGWELVAAGVVGFALAALVGLMLTVFAINPCDDDLDPPRFL
jgi:hypothetical protein